MNKLILVLFLLLFLNTTYSQTSFEAGLFFGGTNYYGEVAAHHGSMKEVGLGLGLMSRLMINRNLGLKGTLGQISLRGSDLNSGIHTSRGWSFETRLLELSLQFEFHPFGRARRNIVGRFNKNQFSPYVFWGFGVAFGTAQVFTSEHDKDLFPEPEVSRSHLILPIGMGVRFDASEYFILSFELGKRAVFSDYIDGISLNGNSLTNDWYLFAGLVISVLISAENEKSP